MSELGQALKEARKEKGMSLDDVLEITKIQKRYLTAIEEGQFDQLPGEFYTRAFIKNYAEAVGLDSGTIFEEYANEIPKTKQAPVEPQLPPRSNRTKKSAPRVRQGKSGLRTILPTAIIVIFIVVVLIIVWMFLQQAANPSSLKKDENNSTISYEQKDTPKPKKQSSTKKTTEKEAKDNTKTEDQQSIKLDNTQGGISNYTLSNTSEFVVNIKVKDGQQSWVTAEDLSSSKRLAYGMATSEKPIHFDATDSKKVHFNIGSSTVAEMKINGKLFKFPNKNSVQKFNITFDKQEQ
ncbi:helix-turn-helix domain-containing protein [Terrilactibacillus sp. BCM23-1]|uniref:Helix-turn-helix domain-containing protein n=1 Tax=Terrilactibacillus tamarindi TaxID=2599694 RepID=A0A6N8CUA8_9BACI|nr:helix-turn-helix domain-containing protein [Terrilactibacillus tamarindi]MTT32877.1 helix-turn-helix domain-containing protein [Terrilactibacillus tamarindi]